MFTVLEKKYCLVFERRPQSLFSISNFICPFKFCKKIKKISREQWAKAEMLLSLELIVRLTRPSVLDVLKGIRLVIHTIVPEKYHYWKSIQSGVCKRSIALEIGPPTSRCKCSEGSIQGCADLCFTNGVVFVAERGSSAIRFIELKSEVLIKPEHLKSRADLLSQLSRIGLSLEGTGPVLRKRLTTHLRSLAAQVENKEIVQINPPLSKLTSIWAASKDILLCADDE